MKELGRYHLLAKRKLVKSDAVSSYQETTRLYNHSPPAILFSDGTGVAEAIVRSLCSAGLDSPVFPLTPLLLTLKTNVK